MSGPQRNELAEAHRWLGEADDELLVIEVLQADRRSPARPTCFHAHLAAEKALKALLIARSVPLPRVHDLARLHQLLPKSDQAAFTESDLADLNPWRVEGRYPADLDEPTAAQLGALIEAAQRVVSAAREIVVA